MEAIPRFFHVPLFNRDPPIKSHTRFTPMYIPPPHTVGPGVSRPPLRLTQRDLLHSKEGVDEERGAVVWKKGDQ